MREDRGDRGEGGRERGTHPDRCAPADRNSQRRAAGGRTGPRSRIGCVDPSTVASASLPSLISHTYASSTVLARLKEGRSAPLDDLLDQLIGERLLRLVVARHLGEHLGLPAPVLEHLRGGFHEVPRHTRCTRLYSQYSSHHTHTIGPYLVPSNLENLVRLNSPWNTCPISWKNVVTSSCVMSAGFPGVSLARLATMAVSG